ncbi:hypothetical protein HF325_002108 [Metschnikowia pulcherrima]|uniref:Uncharacterized protein n=1 Tax=Metschnikowia pulcherrima TaxID=27326 RepID=A0A8H7LCJ0_9ASCO|nr:hypothetical protein HF325_002108 [Metschnikowia pulcherrima]
MMHASSKNALRCALYGVAADIQEMDLFECWSVSAGVLALIRTASLISSHSPQYSTMDENL